MNKNHTYPNFPISRLRRLRKTASLRDMFRETHLTRSDFIYPLFVVEGAKIKKEIERLNRFFLHAERLGFRHPMTNEWLAFQVALPPPLENFLEFLS